MEMTIEIERLRTYAHHGVMPQERRVGNFFETTVRLTYQVADAVTDSLDDTINYADITGIITREMAIPSRLLEHVTWRIRASLLHRFPQVTSGMVRVSKTTPPLGVSVAGAAATLTW